LYITNGRTVKIEIIMADIFISYSSEDKSRIETLANILRAKGWTVWWDREIPAGKHFDAVIEEELERARCVIVIWTSRSVNSEWVKNEANEAVQKARLVPVMLEEVKIPLAFRRIEAARLIGWNGEEEHPELSILLNAVSSILNSEAGGNAVNDLTRNDDFKKNATQNISKKKFRFPLKPVAIICSVIILGVIAKMFLSGKSADNPVTIRILDPQRKPVIKGDIVLHLPDYELSRAVDGRGEALFKDIPANTSIRIDVASQGYDKYTVDTILGPGKTIELVLSTLRVIHISGRVKTAAEVPLKNIEVSVDGTRYYAQSITDGTYNIVLKGYTIGNEITITASGDNYADKRMPLKINAPEMNNIDFVLEPIHH